MNGWKWGAPTASDAKTTLVPLSAQPVASIPRIKVSYPPRADLHLEPPEGPVRGKTGSGRLQAGLPLSAENGHPTELHATAHVFQLRSALTRSSTSLDTAPYLPVPRTRDP